MNNGISILTPRALSDWRTEALINGEWVAARPLGDDSILWRIRCAWKVFKGEYDCLKWPEGQ